MNILAKTTKAQQRAIKRLWRAEKRLERANKRLAAAQKRANKRQAIFDKRVTAARQAISGMSKKDFAKSELASKTILSLKGEK